MAALAAERAEARAGRDWARADALKARIEAAGWKVEDAGRGWSLYRAVPADVEVDGQARYGASASVPSVLSDAASAPATIVVVAEDDPGAVATLLGAARAHLPAGVDVVVVANAPSPAVEGALAGAVDAATGPGVEILRTSARLGRAAALNAGVRRARGAIVILADASLVPSGDAVTPVAAALEDPQVAVAGPVGLSGRDAAHLGPTDAAVPAAIGAGWLAFRRADYVAAGPFDERFVAPEHLDAWWSLTLRAGDAGGSVRRAARLDLPLAPSTAAGTSARSTAAPDVDADGPPASARLARRNAYRVLDAFRDRPDLLADGDGAAAATGRPR